MGRIAGTRSGNSVTLEGVVSAGEVRMDLVWTTDDTFEGTARVEYLDTTTAVFDVDGEADIAVLSLGASSMFGASE